MAQTKRPLSPGIACGVGRLPSGHHPQALRGDQSRTLNSKYLNRRKEFPRWPPLFGYPEMVLVFAGTVLNRPARLH